jgi:hypothetical protein
MNAPKPDRLFDARTVTFLVGLSLAALGGSMLSVPWTLVAVGAVLTYKAVR